MLLLVVILQSPAGLGPRSPIRLLPQPVVARPVLGVQRLPQLRVREQARELGQLRVQPSIQGVQLASKVLNAKVTVGAQGAFGHNEHGCNWGLQVWLPQPQALARMQVPQLPVPGTGLATSSAKRGHGCSHLNPGHWHSSRYLNVKRGARRQLPPPQVPAPIQRM